MSKWDENGTIDLPQDGEATGMQDDDATPALVSRVMWSGELEDVPGPDRSRLRAMMGDKYADGSLFETKGDYLPNLVDERWHDWPLWCIRLPEDCVHALETLARTLPWVENALSADLMTNSTNLVWSSAELHVTVEPELLRNGPIVWSDGDEIKFISVLFMARNSVVVASQPYDEHFIVSLQAAGASSGSNWRPYKVFSEAEIAEAGEQTKNGNIPDVADGMYIHLSVLSDTTLFKTSAMNCS